MTKAYKSIIIIVFSFLIQVFPQQVYGCVEGLQWGMDLTNVESHLGVTDPVSGDIVAYATERL